MLLPRLLAKSSLFVLMGGLLTACPSDPAVQGASRAEAVAEPRPPAVDTLSAAPRDLPDPLCPFDNLGTTGLLVSLPDLGYADAVSGGALADEELNRRLPQQIWLRTARQSFNSERAFVLHEGGILSRPLDPEHPDAGHWRHVLLPGCLDGQVQAISADGTLLLALDPEGWIYTLQTEQYGPSSHGWTRRWGAYFWTDGGEQMPEDVQAWAASEFEGIYIDSAGREQDPAGILTVYTLRGNDWQLSYMDPWLPSDESREVCGPERGSLAIAGLSGSGSQVMVISKEGRVFTRLHEFDISGANTMFLDYSWQDQEGVAEPKIQLPGPEWMEHPPLPGEATNLISLHTTGEYSNQRVLRVEGRNAQGRSGFWEKALEAAEWRFQVTDEPLQGVALPMPGPYIFDTEDQNFVAEIEGYPVRIEGLNPYCSPASMQIAFGPEQSLSLLLHTTDGMRQERRGRGWDAQPHVYRAAVEVPLSIWQQKQSLPEAQQAFLQSHFGEQRFLVGPLDATPWQVVLNSPCWVFAAEDSAALSLDGLVPPRMPDLGILVGEIRAAEEQGRLPAVCPRVPAYGL